MRKPRRIFLLIILLTLISLWVNIPPIPFHFNLGPAKVNTKIEHPNIDLDIFGFKFVRDLEPKLGLDLQGGTYLVLQADMSNINSLDRDNALESAKNVIERRVNLFGVSEPIVQTSKVGNDYRIIVEIPGVKDVEEAKNLIGQTAKLEFREPNPAATTSAQAVGPYIPTNVTGQDLKKATASFDQQKGEPVVEFQLTAEGGKKFEALTKRLIGKPLAIYLDGQPIQVATVQSVIKDNGVISGTFSSDETKQIAIELNAGALPAPVKVVQEHTVGATLGGESINRGIFSGIVGLLIVAIFMIALYGLKGVLADLALVLYTLVVIALFKIIPVTLTLAGIAGFILSIGMAVDANILIFERMKEELRAGRNTKQAIEIGFSRAWSSIRDSNISSLITSFILYWFGTGSVRGFAFTLAIGILVSMFSSIVVTRNLLRIVMGRFDNKALRKENCHERI